MTYIVKHKTLHRSLQNYAKVKVKSVLEEPQGQGHVLKDSNTGYNNIETSIKANTCITT